MADRTGTCRAALTLPREAKARTAVVVADGYEPRAFENGMTIASNLADIVQMDPVGLRKR